MVSHHNNAEIISLLECYFLGNVTIPPIMAPTSTPLYKMFYERWYDFSNTVTLMVNTYEIDVHSSDYTRHNPGNFHSSRSEGAIGVQNARFILQRQRLHGRVIFNTVPSVFGKNFRELFALLATCLIQSSPVDLPMVVPPVQILNMMSSPLGQAALHRCVLGGTRCERMRKIDDTFFCLSVLLSFYNAPRHFALCTPIPILVPGARCFFFFQTMCISISPTPTDHHRHVSSRPITFLVSACLKIS